MTAIWIGISPASDRTGLNRPRFPRPVFFYDSLEVILAVVRYARWWCVCRKLLVGAEKKRWLHSGQGPGKAAHSAAMSGRITRQLRLQLWRIDYLEFVKLFAEQLRFLFYYSHIVWISHPLDLADTDRPIHEAHGIARHIGRFDRSLVVCNVQYTFVITERGRHPSRTGSQPFLLSFLMNCATRALLLLKLGVEPSRSECPAGTAV